jgi:hypothetical protein
MREFARYIYAHVYASVLRDRNVVVNRDFCRSLKLREVKFDPEAMRTHYAEHAGCTEKYPWELDPYALEVFIPAGTENRQSAAAD